jgi:hypothetical protein
VLEAAGAQRHHPAPPHRRRVSLSALTLTLPASAPSPLKLSVLDTPMLQRDLGQPQRVWTGEI